MGQSYRIRTELGVNKTINVQIDQEFEFLEILSLKIQQEDVYDRSCANYGVLVGRITANNGFGLPNVNISVFVPIDSIDQSNPLITSLYPYTSTEDKNEDGYRYNLLPYEKSYSKHAATGTLPSRNDVLNDQNVIDIYDKYYKLTAKTNDSGDYMIMGVPLGTNTVFMDLDLSDIGEFSLTPQDLIRMGIATESQVAGNQFRTSSDLNSLPQIISLSKSVDISPLWGEPDICQIAINRVDFDLRDNANVEIRPTSIFMGSMFTSPDNFRIRSNCKPRDNMGNLCNLQAGPGQILAIRQTIDQDSNGNPILEQYVLEQSGNVIDGSGTWLTELPMNLEYVITNEFGERVISYDPTIGIPTKAKYRFKIKWQQPATLTEQTRRAYYLVPNIREYGWIISNEDPNNENLPISLNRKKQLSSSYYFGLDWTGYTDGIITTTEKNTKLDEIINCEDTFYEFNFNKVYTIAGLIDEYKNGGKGRFIGIKEIDDDNCSSTVNKFPVNDGFRNFDAIYFVFSLLLQIIQLISIPLLIVYHLIAIIWNVIIGIGYFFSSFLAGIAALKFYQGTLEGATLIGTITAINLYVEAGFYLLAGISWAVIFRLIKFRRFKSFTLPSITYPDCIACSCGEDETSAGISEETISLISQFSNSVPYYSNITTKTVASSFDENDVNVVAQTFSIAVGTNGSNKENNSIYKTMKSQEVKLANNDKFFAYSDDLPFSERINIFNTRKKYFDGVNRISVSFDSPYNSVEHYDNTITILLQGPIESGTLLTFVNPSRTLDKNYLYSANTNSSFSRGISGTSLNSVQSTYVVEYADPYSQLSNLSQTYSLNVGSTINNYNFPADIEYYQVVTAITISDASKLWNSTSNGLLPTILNSGTVIKYNRKTGLSWGSINQPVNYKISELYPEFENQYIVILQRGVDPYSPKYTNRYGVGKLFGFNDENSLIITGNTRLNIPIQKITDTSISVQKFNSQDNIYYDSHFFRGGDGFSAFTTWNVGYYSSLDALNSPPNSLVYNVNFANSVTTSAYNDAYSSIISSEKYDLSEDLSGAAYYYVIAGNTFRNTSITYYSNVLLPSMTANPMSISSKIKNVMRTDRLPSSDILDGYSWNYNPSLLQQNIALGIYLINTDEETITTVNFSTGSELVSQDISGQVAALNVINSLNTCGNMVSLDCYTGNSVSFGVDTKCVNKNDVVNGCYIFMRRPLLDLPKDIDNFSEWAYRFRFFYGLCRGVLAQSFTNNWVNGALYSFPIQTNTWYDKNNQPYTTYCSDLIYFDNKTNNFYYRSSPYNYTANKFVGKAKRNDTSVNDLNLLFPTTIVNLGVKDSFYQEISFDPSYKGYIMDKLNTTSYSDTSDLVNLFVISRITNETFLQRLVSFGDNSVNQLFSRPERRIDGDLAQLLSINSEEGVIKFSPEYYASTGSQYDPVIIYNSSSDNPTIGVFYSSTTENLQFKDYLSPGRIDFRGNTNTEYYPYSYGIKSQVVPFYQWKLKNINTIFGTELNNWATNNSEIVQGKEYQSLDRTNRTLPTYFQSDVSPSNNDTYQRGYIFSFDENRGYSTLGTNSNKFMIGAPYHFYFGVIVGESALDKFKTKYLAGE